MMGSKNSAHNFGASSPVDRCRGSRYRTGNRPIRRPRLSLLKERQRCWGKRRRKARQRAMNALSATRSSQGRRLVASFNPAPMPRPVLVRHALLVAGLARGLFLTGERTDFPPRGCCVQIVLRQLSHRPVSAASIPGPDGQSNRSAIARVDLLPRALDCLFPGFAVAESCGGRGTQPDHRPASSEGSPASLSAVPQPISSKGCATQSHPAPNKLLDLDTCEREFHQLTVLSSPLAVEWLPLAKDAVPVMPSMRERVPPIRLHGPLHRALCSSHPCRPWA